MTRKLLFRWHVGLGKFGGALILIWALSGTVMTVQPMLLRALDPGFPSLRAEPADLGAFSVPPARLGSKTASASLRTFRGRSWYELTLADGAVEAYDSRTGAPVAALLSEAEVVVGLAERLAASRWTTGAAVLMDRHDDQYRKGRLPVYKVRMSGPGAVVLYISARDGGVESVTTRWSRLIRWLGLGVHTWNFAAVMRRHDDERGLALAALVSVPLAALAAIAYALLAARSRGKKGAAAVLAGLLAFHGSAPPAQAAFIAVRAAGRAAAAAPPVALPPVGVAAAPPLASPAGPAGLRLPSPSLPALSVQPALALAAARAIPAAAEPARALPRLPAEASRAEPAGVFVSVERLSPARGPEGRGPREGFAAASRMFFDGARRPSGSTVSPVVPEPGRSESQPLGRPPVAAEPPAAAVPPPAPAGVPDGKGIWGLYITHAVHIASLALVWRIAWPLFVLEVAGKGGLGLLGTVDQFSDLALGVAAGVVIDRLLPSRSMAAAALVRAGVGAALAAAAAWWSPGLPFLLGLSAVHAFAMTVIYLGQAAVSPAAAGGDAERLQRLNIVLKLITVAVAIPGSYAGGWLVAHIGTPAAFAAYALLNALVLAPLYAKLLPRDQAPERAEAAGPPPAGLGEVLRFILDGRVLLGLFAATAAAMTFAEPFRNTVLPIVAKELLRGGPVLLGHLMTALYVGQCLGVLALLRWSKAIAPRWWIALAGLGMAASWLLVLVPAYPPMIYAAVFLMSLLTQPAATMIKTLLQKETAERRPELLGRVLGVHLMFYALVAGGETALLAWGFSAFTGGFLAPIVPLAVAYTGLAAVVLVLVLTVLKKGDLR
ncbi:MAG: MFS transporter [Elusimicrobia bacterium]|nr:MFS transporter [Elusimicrobiota bacterium]